MSKKLIAVASAAALALTGLVGIAPANATAATVTFTAGTGGGTGTAADPFLAVVPHTNALTATTNVVQVAVSGSIASGDVVTVSSSGTAKVVADVIAASALIDVRTFGAATLTKTATNTNTLNFYIYDTKADSASTITVVVTETDGGTKSTSTTTKTMEVTSGPSHSVTGLTTPSTLAASASGEFTFKVTDVFGNELDATSATAIPTYTATGSAGIDSGAATYSSSRKLFVGKVTAPANTRPFVVTLDGNAGTSSDGPSNVGLGSSSVDNQLFVVNNPAAATANATATAQIAALTAQLANSRGKDVSVTKKKYNTLARKWNRAFPSQAVKLKP